MRPALLSLLFACDPPKPDDSGAATGPTWYQDVEPIVTAKCATCHATGGIAPFPLTTYEEAAPYASWMKSAVQSGEMPPWPADSACNTYQFDRSLSAEQIEAIAAWSDAGALEGDAANPAAPLDVAIPALSRADVTLQIDEPYTPALSPDECRCFVFDWDEGTSYVTGFGVEPDEDRVVHHVIAYRISPDDADTVRAFDDAEDGPGYACYGGPNADGAGSDRVDSDWLGGWVPGSTGNDYPDGTGIKVEDGSLVVVQFHYNVETAGPLPDQSSVSFKVDDSVDKEAAVAKILDPTWVLGDNMIIPAGETATYSYTYEVPLGVRVYQLGLHMHNLGQSASMVASTGGSDVCMLDIPEWDFHWQGSYTLDTAQVLSRGDTVTLTCTFDNSAGTTDVAWGENSSDEMCLGTAYGTLD